MKNTLHDVTMSWGNQEWEFSNVSNKVLNLPWHI
jgi:hypothetical protein